MPRSERELLELVYRRSAALRLRRRAAAAASVVAVALLVAVAVPPVLRSDHSTGVDMVDRPTTPTRSATPGETDDDPPPDGASPGASVPTPLRLEGALPGAPPPGGGTAATGRIVFVAADEGHHVFTVGADGSAPRRLGTGGQPRWSPDGSQIAFVDEVLAVMNADGTGRRRLDLGAEDPRWSPDGTRIAYVSVTTDPTDANPRVVYACPPCVVVDGPARADIGVVDLRTGDVATVTTGTGWAHAPSWSPDGSRIAFAQHGSGIHSMRPDGTDERRHASDGDVSGVSWSPTGGWIAYTRAAESSEEAVVVLAAADREEVRALHNTRGAYGPVWARDGRAVAFTQWDEIERTAARVVTLDGSVTAEVRGAHPTLSPDGRHIAYCTSDGLWRADRDGANPVLLFAASGCHDPEWSPA